MLSPGGTGSVNDPHANPLAGPHPSSQAVPRVKQVSQVVLPAIGSKRAT